MKKRYEFVAKTPEEAIDNALKSLNCSLEDLDIEIEEQNAKGLFGFLKPKDIKIIASYRDETNVKAPVVENLKKEEATKFEKEEIKSTSTPEIVEKTTEDTIKEVKTQNVSETVETTEVINSEEISKIALEFLKKLTKSMDMEVYFEVFERDDEIKINIIGKDSSALIGRRGSTLDSLQYLTGLVVSKHTDKYKRIILDSSNYRDQREKTLIELANRIAKKVVKTKRSVYLEPMNPYERQIIHSSLQSNTKVTTKSEGVDPYRKVIVSLKR